MQDNTPTAGAYLADAATKLDQKVPNTRRNRRRAGIRRPVPFRPVSITQHPEPNSFEKMLRQKATPHDTVPGRTAREWFVELRTRRHEARPLITPETVLTYSKTRSIIDAKTGERKRVPYTQRVVRPPVFGKSTFQNRIVKGEHV